MSIKYIIPNSLTIFRLIATLLMGLQMVLHINITDRLPLIIGLTGLIYLSDYFDGRLARKWDCCTTLGAKLDIIVDLFYIISQCILLIWHGLMSPAILLLILFEFSIFALTSKIQSQQSKKMEFLFDKVGRGTAVYYYLIPLLYLLLSLFKQSVWAQNIILVANSICLIMTVSAVMCRIKIHTITSLIIPYYK